MAVSKKIKNNNKINQSDNFPPIKSSFSSAPRKILSRLVSLTHALSKTRGVGGGVPEANRVTAGCMPTPRESS